MLIFFFFLSFFYDSDKFYFTFDIERKLNYKQAEKVHLKLHFFIYKIKVKTINKKHKRDHNAFLISQCQGPYIEIDLGVNPGGLGKLIGPFWMK